MSTFSIQITDELAQAIETLAQRLGTSKEELVVSMLERQVLLAQSAFRTQMSVEEFEDIRRRLQPYAEQARYTSEEEVLKDIS